MLCSTGLSMFGLSIVVSDQVRWGGCRAKV